MRIVVVAPGAVGGYFGGLLAKAGENVGALARGAHLAAIREGGLRIEGPDGEHKVRLDASDDAAQLGSADVVLFAVKLYQAAAGAVGEGAGELADRRLALGQRVEIAHGPVLTCWSRMRP
jgi:2-dehydropantoate 2-reductase